MSSPTSAFSRCRTRVHRSRSELVISVAFIGSWVAARRGRIDEAQRNCWPARTASTSLSPEMIGRHRSDRWIQCRSCRQGRFSDELKCVSDFQPPGGRQSRILHRSWAPIRTPPHAGLPLWASPCEPLGSVFRCDAAVVGETDPCHAVMLRPSVIAAAARDVVSVKLTSFYVVKSGVAPEIDAASSRTQDSTLTNSRNSSRCAAIHHNTTFLIMDEPETLICFEAAAKRKCCEDTQAQTPQWPIVNEVSPRCGNVRSVVTVL